MNEFVLLFFPHLRNAGLLKQPKCPLRAPAVPLRLAWLTGSCAHAAQHDPLPEGTPTLGRHHTAMNVTQTPEHFV